MHLPPPPPRPDILPTPLTGLVYITIPNPTKVAGHGGDEKRQGTLEGRCQAAENLGDRVTVERLPAEGRVEGDGS